MTVQAWETGAERLGARGPILDFLISSLGGCPESDPSVLLDLALVMAPYLHWRNADQERDDGGPLTRAPVRWLPEAVGFEIMDSTAGQAQDYSESDHTAQLLGMGSSVWREQVITLAR